MTPHSPRHSLAERKVALDKAARTNRYWQLIAESIGFLMLLGVVSIAFFGVIPSFLPNAEQSASVTPEATGGGGETEQAAPEPQADPIEEVTIEPMGTPLKGSLTISDGWPCEAGQESWHNLTITNDGTVDVVYKLDLPSGVELFDILDNCPLPGELPTPLDATAIGPIEPNAMRTFTLRYLLSTDAAPIVKLMAAGEAEVLDEQQFIPWQGRVQVGLSLSELPAENRFIRTTNLEIPLVLTIDQVGRYVVVCQHSTEPLTSESSILAVGPETVNQSLDATCLLPDESSVAGEWKASVYPMLPDDVKSTTPFDNITVTFNVEEPHYQIVATQVENIGLTWGPAINDIGLIVIYEIINQGNVSAIIGIQVTNGNTNLKEARYINVLKPGEILAGTVKSFNVGEFVTLLSPHGADHIVEVTQLDPNSFVFLQEELPPCIPSQECPSLRVAVWLKTIQRDYINDSDKSVEYTVSFAVQESEGLVETVHEKIIEPPAQTIKNPNATKSN